MKCVCFIITFGSCSFVFANDCIRWFEEAKIKKDGDCLLECVSTQVDMSTFDCPGKCKDFCKTSGKEKFIFNLSYVYGLTDEERALAAKYPSKTLTAYLLSRRSESLCSRLYKDSSSNDSSDACRHFVWAALLYKTYGREFSSQILDAHEQNENQPIEEKSMDLANNRLGQRSAAHLIEQKKFNETEILKSFKDNLERGRVIVLEDSPNKDRYYRRYRKN